MEYTMLEVIQQIVRIDKRGYKIKAIVVNPKTFMDWQKEQYFQDFFGWHDPYDKPQDINLRIPQLDYVIQVHISILLYGQVLIVPEALIDEIIYKEGT